MVFLLSPISPEEEERREEEEQREEEERKEFSAQTVGETQWMAMRMKGILVGKARRRKSGEPVRD